MATASFRSRSLCLSARRHAPGTSSPICCRHWIGCNRRRRSRSCSISGIERCFRGGGREDYNDAIEQQLYQALVVVSLSCHRGPARAMRSAPASWRPRCATSWCAAKRRRMDTPTCRPICIPRRPKRCCSANGSATPRAGLPVHIDDVDRQAAAQKRMDVSHPAGRASRRVCTEPGIDAGGEIAGRALVVETASDASSGRFGQRTDARRCRTRNRRTPSDTVAAQLASPAKHVHLDTSIDHVLVIKLCADGKDVNGRRTGCGSRRCVLPHRTGLLLQSRRARQRVSRFSSGTRLSEAAVPRLQRLLLESSVPVVAALERNAKGDAWLISQFCDACVYSRTGVYSAATIDDPELLHTAAAVFAHRFGHAASREILLTGADYSGWISSNASAAARGGAG